MLRSNREQFEVKRIKTEKSEIRWATNSLSESSKSPLTVLSGLQPSSNNGILTNPQYEMSQSQLQSNIKRETGQDCGSDTHYHPRDTNNYMMSAQDYHNLDKGSQLYFSIASVLADI